MEIYVDKLPVSCEECLLKHVDTSNHIRCNLTMFIVLDIALNSKSEDCPLKELKDFSHITEVFNTAIKLNQLLYNNIQKTEAKSPFTYTDWEGARNAIKNNIKVTIEDFELRFSGFDGYKLEKDGHKYTLYDKHFSSKKWKIWEN